MSFRVLAVVGVALLLSFWVGLASLEAQGIIGQATESIQLDRATGTTLTITANRRPVPLDIATVWWWKLPTETEWGTRAISGRLPIDQATYTFTITGLTPLTTYDVRVSDIEQYLDGGTGVIRQFRTTAAPSVSTIFGAAATLTSITMQVGIANPEVTPTTINYRYKLSTSSSWQSARTTTAPANAASHQFTVSSLTADTLYDFEAWIDTAQTFSRSARTDRTSVTSISTVSATFNSIAARANVNLPPGGTYSLSYRYRASGGSWGSENTVTASGSSELFTITGLDSNTLYNIEAWVGSSPKASASIRTSFNTFVSTLTLTSSTITSLNIRANIANPPSSSYTLSYQYKRVIDSNYTSRTTTVSANSATKDFSISGLSTGVAYNVRARIGTTAWTNRVYTTGTTSVSGLVKTGSTLTSVSLRANIDNPPSNTFTLSYRYKPAASFNWGSTQTLSVSGGASSSSFTISTLTAGTSYNFQAWVGSSAPAVLTTSTSATSVSSIASLSVTPASGTLRATIANPSGSNFILLYRYKRQSDPNYGATQSTTVTGGSTSHTFTISNLQFSTTYDVQAWVGTTSAAFGTFTTGAPPATTTSLTLGTRTSNGATFTVGISNPAGTAYRLTHRYKPSSASFWSNQATSNYSGTAATRTITLSGLTPGTPYDLEAGISSVSEQSITFSTLVNLCSTSNSAPTGLGTLPTTRNANLPPSQPQAGTIPATGGCVDSDNRASQFYTFTLAEGGGVLLDVAAAENSALSPDVQLVSAPGGSVLLSNAVVAGTNARVGTVLAAGTYTVQVRSTYEETSAEAGRHGAYLLQIRRIYPELVSLVAQTSSIHASYNVHTTAPNMETVIQYRLGSTGNWSNVGGQSMYRNDPVGIEMMTPNAIVGARQTGLTINREYQFRAKFQHASDSQYSAVSRAITSEFVGLPAPGTPVIGSADYNEPGEPFSVILRVSWAYPEVRVSGGGGGANWWYNVDWGETQTNNGRSQQANNVLGVSNVGDTLSIRVQLVVNCIDNGDATPEPCQVFLRGLTDFSDANDRIEILEGLTVQSAWSHPVVFVVRDAGAVVNTGIEPDPEGKPWVVDSISNIFITFGADTSPETAENWALILCLVLSLVAFALGFLTTNQGSGDNFWAMAFGGFLFFVIWSLAGPEWFGIPSGFAYGTIAVPVMLGLIALVKHVRT